MTAYINGFSVSASPSAIGVRNFRVPGATTSLPVRSEIAPLLIGYAAEYHRLVEPLHYGWCWAYAYRRVTGGYGYSWHSAGIAVDLNAPAHPYGRRNTFGSADRDRVRALCRKYGLRWGGDYRSNADDMHAEVILSRGAALDLVRRLQTQGSITYRQVYAARLEPGVRGSQSVRHLQRELNRRDLGTSVTVDGDYGRATEERVTRWKARNDWSNRSGDVGPDATRRLFHDHDDIQYTIHWDRR